ncbi:4'-phosphopantetheinyl transferase family protein [Streptomyces fulvorobeus]|uniref:4'-phosphopantetheinyl transferase n=1 Tax=Streptomyces fulvorobeus TaxID=284028 RepID=A0A7J0CG72_9ACTN|nr:4'-phosphopantetheinyl transferase superfamily protein [Streptomyces fulvorobeus]NYE44717.1 4'-phosphopantetheinyl transferase EntD [Streptomyces fulvorobeus]GFN01268.1 4'-phosphopantetheinyl transferase [Streptomyces fulvorobeus]
MIRALLPAGVAAEVAYDDARAPEERLFPQETALIAHAVPKRQQEFTTVRFLARRALRTLGQEPAPLLPNRRGAPQWPQGIVGSMTHCDGYRAAVVARSDTTAALGIDAEPDAPLPDGVLDAIALPHEIALIGSLTARRPGISWDRLVFSAKESVFKVWYPLTGRELDFPEAEIDISEAERTFRARLFVPGPLVAGRRIGEFHGRWTAERGLLATAIHLAHDAPPAPTTAARTDGRHEGTAGHRAPGRSSAR